MHGYYQKNLKKWHKTLNSYMNYISYELESLTGQSYDTLIQEIWTNYQAEMLERFPYIGGDAASGTKNLIGAYMFVSMGEVLKKIWCYDSAEQSPDDSDLRASVYKDSVFFTEHHG